jgi:hypothetical protein
VERYILVDVGNQDLPGEHTLCSKAVVAGANGDAHSAKVVLPPEEAYYLMILV